MKSSIVILWLLTTYLVLVAALYTVWYLIDQHTVEWTGTVVILLSGALTGFIASFLGLTHRKSGGILVEDLDDADIDDGEPELGDFSPWSWWPFTLAGGAAVIVLGICIGGWWLFFLALPLAPIAVVGWVFEYYRGNFAR